MFRMEDFTEIHKLHHDGLSMSEIARLMRQATLKNGDDSPAVRSASRGKRNRPGTKNPAN